MHTKMRKAGSLSQNHPSPRWALISQKCSPHQERQSRVRASYPSLWWHHVKVPLWFHHTQTGKVETFREQEQEEKQELPLSGRSGRDHISVTCSADDPSSFTTEEITTAMQTPADIPSFSHTNVHVHSHQPPEFLRALYPLPFSEPGTHSQYRHTQLRKCMAPAQTPAVGPAIVCTPGLAPLAMYLHTAGFIPITSFQ